MNKAVCLFLALIFSSILFSPCRKAEGQQPRQKDELNIEAMKDLASTKHELERQQQEADKKARKLERNIKVSPGAITEKDQQVVDALSEGALVTPNIFRTESGAIKYVKILLKGDHNSFRFFRAIKTENERKTSYDEAMESALSRISTKNKDANDVATQVIKTKSNYPRAEKEALRVINGR